MNNRYISLKLEESVLQKIAKSYVVKLAGVSDLVELSFSFCKLQNASDDVLYAIAELSEASESLNSFVENTGGVEFLDEISDYEILEENCELLNILLTTTQSANTEISKTLLIFDADNFENIAKSLYKIMSWKDFSAIPVAFLQLPKILQPRIFVGAKICAIKLDFDATNLLKLPEIQNVVLIKYFESADENLTDVFFFEAEKPLFASILHADLQNTDEITLIGNAKPPISIKTTQFNKMKQYVSLAMPEIAEPKLIDDIKIETPVNMVYSANAEISDLEEYSYVAFSLKSLNAYFEDVFSKVDLKVHKFEVFEIGRNEKIILFDRSFIVELNSRSPEFMTAGVFFKQIEKDLFLAHLLNFKPKPQKRWLQELVKSENSNTKLLLISDSATLQTYFGSRNKYLAVNHQNSRQELTQINILKLGQNLTSAESLIYAINPQLGNILKHQQDTSFDRIKRVDDSAN